MEHPNIPLVLFHAFKISITGTPVGRQHKSSTVEYKNRILLEWIERTYRAYYTIQSSLLYHYIYFI